MSKIEIFILILASCIPLFSFLIVFKPKLKNIFKKKDKTKKDKIVEEVKPEEKPEEKIVEQKPKEKTLRDEIQNTFVKNDFKDFMEIKKDSIKFPEMKLNSPDFITSDYETYLKKPEKTIAEQIKSLSPELKALIVAGVLDKKDIDNI